MVVEAIQLLRQPGNISYAVALGIQLSQYIDKKWIKKDRHWEGNRNKIIFHDNESKMKKGERYVIFYIIMNQSMSSFSVTS